MRRAALLVLLLAAIAAAQPQSPSDLPAIHPSELPAREAPELEPFTLWRFESGAWRGGSGRIL